MSDHILKSHNKTLLLYHLVFPAKYRRKVFANKVDERLKVICLGISERYEIHFVEIGVEDNHVHFLVQSVPTLTVTRIVTIIKSITGREIFRLQLNGAQSAASEARINSSGELSLVSGTTSI